MHAISVFSSILIKSAAILCLPVRFGTLWLLFSFFMSQEARNLGARLDCSFLSHLPLFSVFFRRPFLAASSSWPVWLLLAVLAVVGYCCCLLLLPCETNIHVHMDLYREALNVTEIARNIHSMKKIANNN